MTATTMDEKIAELEETIESQAKRIERLLRERAEDRQRIAELEEYRAENEREKALKRKENSQNDSSKASAEGSNDSEGAERSLMAVLIEDGPDALPVHVDRSTERAAVLAKYLKSWASKAPNGLVIKENIRTLLSTAIDQDLQWIQAQRACNKLEAYSDGAIEYKDHPRFGKILVADPSHRLIRSL